MITQQLRETASISERAAQAAKTTGKMLVQFISPGWGSSGYYSPEVLQEAAANRMIPAGTHMYADHPTQDERNTRPERSIRDLMAVTTGDAQLAANGALVGEVRVMAPYQELLTDLKDHIGVSVFGDATDIYEGEAEGRRGKIVAGLAHISSVDFVTRPGRGGQVLELLESAQMDEPLVREASDHVYHWKHGWIPLDHAATGEKYGGSNPAEAMAHGKTPDQLRSDLAAVNKADAENLSNMQKFGHDPNLAKHYVDLDQKLRMRREAIQTALSKHSGVGHTDRPRESAVEVLPDAWLLDGIHVELAEALHEVITSPAGAEGTAKLHAYWRHGEGAAKIRWGVAGDFQRCVDHLGKYVRDPKGYCAKMHKDVTGAVPGHAPGESHESEVRDIPEFGAISEDGGKVYHWKHGWIPLDHTAAPEVAQVEKLAPSQRREYATHRSSGMSHSDAMKAVSDGDSIGVGKLQSGHTFSHEGKKYTAVSVTHGDVGHYTHSSVQAEDEQGNYHNLALSKRDTVTVHSSRYDEHGNVLPEHERKGHYTPTPERNGDERQRQRMEKVLSDAETGLKDAQAHLKKDPRGRDTYQMVITQHKLTIKHAKAELRKLARKKSKESDVPATRPDSTKTIEETTEVTMGKIQIEEADYDRVLEEAGRVDALTAERDTEKARADELAAKLAENVPTPTPPTGPAKRTSHAVVVEQLEEQKHEIAVLNARERARDIVAEEMTEAWVAPSTIARLTSTLLADLPLVEDKLDEVALRTSCVEARDRAEMEAAETLDAAGFGKPTGLGASTPPAGGDVSRYNDTIAESLRVFGLSEAEAAAATKGR